MFRFIHCSDLHLGTPFFGIRKLDASLRDRLHNATFDSFERLCGYAIENRVDFVVVSGDIYDGIKYGAKAARFLQARLGDLVDAEIGVFICLGNHDEVGQLLAGVAPVPRGVHVFSADRAETEVFVTRSGEEVYIHGRSFPSRTVNFDLSSGFPNPTVGKYNIGLLHCTLDGSMGHEVQAPVSHGVLERFGYNYWALGHIHTKTLSQFGDCHINYSGNLQGLSMKPSERGVKGALECTVMGPRTEVKFLPISRIQFDQCVIDVSNSGSAAEEDDLMEIIGEEVQGWASNQVEDLVSILRIELVGRYSGVPPQESELDEMCNSFNRYRRWEGAGSIYVESIRSGLLPIADAEQLALLGGLLEAITSASAELASLSSGGGGVIDLIPSGARGAPAEIFNEFRQSLLLNSTAKEASEALVRRILDGGLPR